MRTRIFQSAVRAWEFAHSVGKGYMFEKVNNQYKVTINL